MPPYEPEEVLVPDGADAFPRLVAAVRARFPRLLVCDLEGRRLQSAWIDVDDGVVPGRQRVSVFPTARDRVGIVVERSWLRQDFAGAPYWTAPVGDRDAERELAAALRAALTP
ncbi:MAG TPA: hypothetical protein VK081_04220 [Planctomycetota bacterium]|nr:hypothetical protein [Planctomycetota bacterium]